MYAAVCGLMADKQGCLCVSLCVQVYNRREERCQPTYMHQGERVYQENTSDGIHGEVWLRRVTKEVAGELKKKMEMWDIQKPLRW